MTGLVVFEIYNMPKSRTQKILVPKGTINPYEDTLIEIPAKLQGHSMVVAKQPGSPHSLNVDRSVRSNISSNYEDPKSSTSVKFINSHFGNDDFEPNLHSTTLKFNNSDISTAALDNLDETELAEKKSIYRKLEDFQKARRRFLLESTLVASKSGQMPYLDSRVNDSEFDNTQILSYGLSNYAQDYSTPINIPPPATSQYCQTDIWSANPISPIEESPSCVYSFADVHRDQVILLEANLFRGCNSIKNYVSLELK